MKLPFKSDCHVHTDISPCALRESTPDRYFSLAKEADVETIGFTNHFWDADVGGTPQWLEECGMPSLYLLKEQVAALDTKGVRVLFGAEVEFTGKAAITVKHSEEFDFLILSTSHFHEEAAVDGIELPDWQAARNLLCQRFLLGADAASKLAAPVSLAHVFHPLGPYMVNQPEIIASISDREFLEMFGFAAEKRVSVEIHYPTLKTNVVNYMETEAQSVRMYKLAKRAGCTFTLGSDEHSWNSFAHKNKELRALAKEIGITPEDMMEI